MFTSSLFVLSMQRETIDPITSLIMWGAVIGVVLAIPLMGAFFNWLGKPVREQEQRRIAERERNEKEFRQRTSDWNIDRVARMTDQERREYWAWYNA